MSPASDAFKVFVYCDDESHAPRRVAVTNFLAVPSGGWHEQPASRAPTGDLGTGHQMIGDKPAATGWANDPSVSNADVRQHYELVCRKCRRRPLRVRPERLFDRLDGWRRAGESSVSLSLLAASIASRSGD